MMNKSTYQKIYILQQQIRYIEKTISEKYHENQMRCPTHLSLGQEAIAAATGVALKNGQRLSSLALPTAFGGGVLV